MVITFMIVTTTLTDLNALPIGNLFFYSKLFNEASGGIYK